MAHNINYTVYNEKVNKKAVQEMWDHRVACEDYQEGATGLPRRIRWIEDIICDNQDDAKEFIAAHDNADYDQLAVRFRDTYSSTPTAKEKELQKKADALHTAYLETVGISSFSKMKSEYRGCKGCGSKLSVKHLRSAKCPLCGTDLRSETAIQAEANARKRWKEALSKLEQEKKKHKSTKICWLLKTEYHT